MALTEAQKRAQKKYREKNKEKINRIKRKSAAKTFIENDSNLEELMELKKIVGERLKDFQ